MRKTSQLPQGVNKEHICIIVTYLITGLLFLETGKKFLLPLNEFSCIEIIALVTEVLRVYFGEVRIYVLQ